MRKITAIFDQLAQYSKEWNHSEHYFKNILRILFNVPMIDYRVISHGNLLVHSSTFHRLF